MKEAIARMILLTALGVAFAAATARAQTTQPAPRDDAARMRDAGSATMPSGDVAMGQMGQGGMGQGGMGAGGAGAQYTCCPPGAMSTMMQGGWRWVPMLLGAMLALSVIAVLISLSIFLLRRSRPRLVAQG